MVNTKPLTITVDMFHTLGHMVRYWNLVWAEDCLRNCSIRSHTGCPDTLLSVTHEHWNMATTHDGIH